jgi:ETC complex I subunit conserved region
MQSGGRTKRAWVLAFEPKSPRWVEPLMGWTASDDPFAQVRLTFPDLASAVDYAERQGLDYQVIDPPARRNAQLGRSGGQAMPSAPHHDRLELMMMKR